MASHSKIPRLVTDDLADTGTGTGDPGDDADGAPGDDADDAQLAGAAARRHRGVAGLAGGILLAAVIGAALVIGAHHRAPPRTQAARLDQIASQLRCPSCVDESAAVALTPAAAAIRSDIATRLREGQSAPRIIAYMVSRYGQWILLDPRTSGLDVAVWAAPAAFAGGALTVVAVAYYRARRRRRRGVALADDDQQLVADLLARWPEDQP